MYVIFAWKNWMRHMLMPTTVMIYHFNSKRINIRTNEVNESCNGMVWRSKDYRAQSEEIRCTLEDLRFACFLSGLVPNTFCLIVNNTVTTSTFRWWRWETIIGYGCATVKVTFSILLNGYSSPFRLDRNAHGGGILLYSFETFTCRRKSNWRLFSWR